MKNLKKTMSKIFKVVPALTLVLCSLQPAAQSVAYGSEHVLAPPIACEESDYAVAANEDLATAFEYETDAEPEIPEEPNASATPETSEEPDASIYELPEGAFDHDYFGDETQQIISETQNGMYFLNNEKLTFYSFSSHNAESVYTFEGDVIDSYVEKGKLYVYNYTYDYLVNTYRISIYNLDKKSFEKDIELDFISNIYGAVGADAEGRIYLAYGPSETPEIYLLSPDGEILSKTSAPEEIYNFSGFDTESGRFYYEFEYAVENSFERYVALGTGIIVDNTITLDEKPIRFLSNYYRTQKAAELIGGKYLCADVIADGFYDNLDRIGLYVYDITKPGGAEPIYFERDYRDGWNSSVDVSGVGAIYNDDNNSIAAVSHEDDLIIEKSMSNGETLSVYKAAHPIFSLSTFGNSIVAVEKESESGIDVYYIEFIERKSEGSEVTIKGHSDIIAGKNEQLTAMIDGEIESEFEWKSSDPKIASVSNNGSVSAWNQGTAVLTATSSFGIAADFTIKVSANPDITLSAGSPVSLNGEVSNNISANGYSQSYLTENSDGTYTRVEHIDYRNKIIVEDYNKSGSKVGSETLDMELPIFGGYFSGSEYNYLALGQTNEAESDSREILRVIKYSKDWKRVGAASVYGAYTTIPFDGGSLRMAETNGKLYIHTCHVMYTTDDGLNHQKNMSYTIAENNMEIVDSAYEISNYVGYTSHSFNQFIQTDGEYIYRVDHGDAYPRGIQLSSYPVSGNMYSGDEIVIFEIYGETGDNYTGVSVGGFELSSDMCITAGNSIQQNETAFNNENSPRNIFITVTDKDLKSSETKWITNYTGKSIAIGTPHLTKFDDDRLLLMWEEYNYSTYKTQTKLVTLDGHGNYTSDIKTTTLPLSDCKPIMCSDNIVRWYCTNSTAPILCAVNPYNLDSAYNGGITILGDNTSTAPPEATTRPSTPGTGGGTGGGGGNGGFSGGGGGFSNGSGYIGGTTVTEPSYTETPSNTTPESNTVFQNSSGSLPFVDVNYSDWYYDGVEYAYANGLMNGTSATLFEPEATMTRGMLVTVLGRAEGVSGGSGSAFSDVDPDEYYAPYIAWASNCGIVNGVGGGMFEPDDTVTREQIAKIFKGYYEYLGDAANSSSAVDYADAYLISDWAVPGVAFCKEKGLMQGKDGNTFDPQGGATRAEAATILMRAGIGK